MYTRDTIAAIATGRGRAGVGIVRVSGPAVGEIAVALTGQTLPPRQAQLVNFLGEQQQAIDEGLAIQFVAPHSYTGEDVLELQGHGGPVVLDMVLSRVLACGARPARPGEFTERAFLNDKMDLAQAEAVADLIDASSEAAAKAAMRSLDGEFSSAIDTISEELMNLRAWLEAALDFSEEEIDFLADSDLQARVQKLLADFDATFAKAAQGRRLTDGLTVVLAGVTNVGKSSLLNALAGSDRAIVTDIAGTTRDVLHEHIELDGVPLHLIDTAGIRLTDDVVEQHGIDKAQEAVSRADHVLVLVDATNPTLPNLAPLQAGREEPTSGQPNELTVPATLVVNKVDANAVAKAKIEPLQQAIGADQRLHISAQRGDGLDELRAHLIQLAGRDTAVEGVFSARRRHLDALTRARAATNEALQRLTTGVMPELAAEELRLARQALDEVTGRFDTEDLLGRVFGQFCIGK